MYWASIVFPAAGWHLQLKKLLDERTDSSLCLRVFNSLSLSFGFETACSSLGVSSERFGESSELVEGSALISLVQISETVDSLGSSVWSTVNVGDR